jgi:hypothetical protein
LTKGLPSAPGVAVTGDLEKIPEPVGERRITFKHTSGKIMKIRAVKILIGLAISFASVAFAREKEEVNPFPFHAISASPQIAQQLEAVNLQFDEAFNKHDATAMGALYIKTAAQVTPIGTFSGREAIQGYFTDLFQRLNPDGCSSA